MFLLPLQFVELGHVIEHMHSREDLYRRTIRVRVHAGVAAGGRDENEVGWTCEQVGALPFPPWHAHVCAPAMCIVLTRLAWSRP